MIKKIRSILSKHFSHFILFLSAILVMICALNFLYLFDITAQSNDECLWRDSDFFSEKNIIRFDLVKVDGVTWSAGIRNGDRLISINGKPAINTLVASKTLDVVSSGDYAVYVVERNGKQFTTNVYIKKLVSFNNLAFTLLSSFWLIVGFFVLMAKPEGKIQRLFFSVAAFSVLFSMNSLLTRGQQVDNPILRNLFLLRTVDILILAGGVFWAFSMVRFFSVFPIESNFERKKWIRKTLILSPWIISALVLAARIRFVYIDRTQLGAIITGNFVGFLIVTSLVTSFIQLIISYRKVDAPGEKRALRIILTAHTIGLSAIIYFILFTATTNQVVFNDPLLFMPIILIAIIPIAFGYAIFRYALMDIREAVKSTIVYGTATVSIAAVYFIIMLLLGQVVSSAIGTQYQGAIAGFVFVVFAIVFQSTKDHFQDYLTQKFYPEQFAFQKGLLKFSGDIAKVVGIENILNSTRELYVESLRIGKYGLMLKKNGGLFHLLQHHGINELQPQLFNGLQSLSQFFVERKKNNKRIVLERQNFNNILGDDAAIFINEGIFSIIPLMINDRLIGLLLFGLKQTGSQFDGKDLDLLISAANQTAISIENARLYHSEIEKKRLERDLENARHIQESLLPKSIPVFKNLELFGITRPAQHVGGDYYDFIRVSDTKLFAIVGDVSGKGLSAALYMSKLQTMIRLYCADNKSPKEILTEVNKKLFGDMERNYFITVTLAMIDIEKGKTQLCRAGHPSTLLFDENGCERIKSSGIGLGLDKGDVFDASLEEVEREIKQGGLLAIYSDGISEAMNDKQDEFGEENIVRVLKENLHSRVDDIQNRLLSEVNSFCGGAEQHDDITLLLVKFS
ncbi:MAG: Serine phosphatase RsbU subunit sigma [Stygiobacter sp.]|nr:MAG: Serine phosphatase RsbU subunit sigma [Stygiobacter sp.]KAF0215865.1 MAG: Serine phosphatase RsbU subunit [Ignavibacteria bacterium]